MTHQTPELAAEVTIQPVDLVGVDAAIIFSDILVIPEAMGMELLVEEGKGGPRFPTPLRSTADIFFAYLLQALSIEPRHDYAWRDRGILDGVIPPDAAPAPMTV